MSPVSKEFENAYDYLVPTDQELIDALLFTLATKEKVKERLTKEVRKFLEENPNA